MSADEIAIRAFLPAWFDATTRGDSDALKAMLTEDALFLTAGSPPMNRDAFLAAYVAGQKQVRVTCEGEYEEVAVSADMAYARAVLTVTVTPLAGGKAMVLSGHTLSVFRNQPDGRWLLARDANFLSPK